MCRTIARTGICEAAAAARIYVALEVGTGRPETGCDRGARVLSRRSRQLAVGIHRRDDNLMSGRRLSLSRNRKTVCLVIVDSLPDGTLRNSCRGGGSPATRFAILSGNRRRAHFRSALFTAVLSGRLAQCLYALEGIRLRSLYRFAGIAWQQVHGIFGTQC